VSRVVPFVIDDILAGKAVDVALDGVRRGWRKFKDQDSLGRLLVLLHADFGRETSLGRGAFYAWRGNHPELEEALRRVLSGQLADDAAGREGLARLIAARLVRTPPPERAALAARVAGAAFRAAPLAVEGGGEDTRLLLARISQIAASLAAVPPPAGPVRVVFNLPAVAANFTGRGDELAELDELLAGADRVVVTAISGLGGVGKTQLAARYAQEHAHEYEAVAWIRAEDGGTRDLASFAVKLGLLVEGLAPADRAELALDWLSASSGLWLLVLDNVASPLQLEQLLPRAGNGRVLVTSRDRSLREFAPILTLDVFDENTATRYLTERAGRPGDPDAARELALALGCLPLALSHAAAYCQHAASFSEYHGLLTGLPARELFDTKPEVSYALTVASTWAASIQAANTAAPLAGETLEFAAYLAPDAIPKTLFEALAYTGTPRVANSSPARSTRSRGLASRRSTARRSACTACCRKPSVTMPAGGTTGRPGAARSLRSATRSRPTPSCPPTGRSPSSCCRI
jgi:hypothetical protein